MTSVKLPYEEFLRAKMVQFKSRGIEVAAKDIHPWLKPHARDVVRWGLKNGYGGIFLAFGLHKTSIQLDIGRLLVKKVGGRFLIVAPLGVRQEFKRDAEKMGIRLRFIRRTKEIGSSGIYITNYESVRDGKIDVGRFMGASLDEAAILADRGNKTFGEFTFKLFVDVKYKFVATATPDPNEFQELLSYAAFLGVADISQVRTRFFKRNSTQADKLTLHPHKEREFWLWVSTWAVFLQKPSDLGYSDEGYNLPEMEINWHEVQTEALAAEVTEEHKGKPGKSKNRWQQQRLIKGANIGVVGAAREKRNSLYLRLRKVQELRQLDPLAHRVIWHDLEAERGAIERAIPEAVTIYGKQDLDERERKIVQFSDGRLAEIAAKPSIAGSGCNLQRHCWWEIFMGIGFKFRDFIQAIHRVYRFGQNHAVRIDLIYTDAELQVRRELERKWEQHKAQATRMQDIIRTYGLGAHALKELKRTFGVERRELVGADGSYLLANNDCILETRGMDSSSVGMVLTSLPFSTQYEYTPSYHDFGHTEDNEHFFAQMDYLTPELLRVLKPGRVAAIHCKDRIMPGGMTGLGFQTVYPFHSDIIRHFTSHGFAFLGMKTVVTDVVRENNQTYRLGWTEQCKDGSRMGAGLPEYVLLFRKPPTDSSNGYADEPVRKTKPLCRSIHHGDTETQRTTGGFTTEATEDDGGRAGNLTAKCAEDAKEYASVFDPTSSFATLRDLGGENVVEFDRDLDIIPGTGYSRAKWQLDAHGFTRSDGNRLLCEDEFKRMKWGEIYRLFRKYSFFNQYCFAEHVRLTEALEAAHRLPNDFMLMPPQSWHPDVWTDVTRMRTLNGAQHAKGREMHLCPLQFDIVERLIIQFTMEGEEVYDPFGGLMTVPYCAVKLRRRGRGCELEPRYFLDGAEYCRAAEEKMATPTLFDLTGPEENTLPLMNADDADLEELAADERRLPQITPTPLKHRGTEGAEVRE